MGILSLIKSKSDPSKPLPRVVLDLDSVVVDEISFRFNGEMHVIRPIETAEFLKITQLMVQFDAVRKSSSVDANETIEMYADLFHMVCPSINRKHIMDMTSPQLIRLHALILDCISGKAYKDEPESDQKKNLKKT